MGFWDSMMDEAGSKTGKAIGNAIFGKKGADQTINLQGGFDGGSNRGTDISNQLELQKQNIEMQAEIRENERNQKILDDIMLLEFDAENVANNVKILTKLSSMIDIWIKDEDMISFYEVAITKFDMGLLVSQTIDPQNPFVALMAKKKDEWNSYIAKQEELEKQRLLQIEQERLEREKQKPARNKKRVKKILLTIIFVIVLFILILALL